MLEFQGRRVGRPKFLCPEKKERTVPDSTLLYGMRAGTQTNRRYALRVLANFER